MNLLQYSKAFVPLAVAAVLALLAGLGIDEEMTVKDAVTLALTSFVVWLVPNKKK
jgi:predicted methyltransferase MtxX (methanogen marker protein 4)